MIKDKNISQVTETISMQMREDEENFIYQRIRPFCEEIVERKINKKEFEKILIAGINALKQDPCEDAISRQAVLDYAKDTCLDLDKFEDTEVFCDEIKLLPPVTPQPKNGRWVHNKCDKCGASRPPLFDNYCPNCGSKMEVVE